MKKLLRILLLTALLTAALGVCALAAEPTEAGVYDIRGTGATLTPKTAAGETIGVDNTDTSYPGYYAGAVKFTVSANGLTAGNQYLLLVVKGTENVTVSAETIVYIDQAAAESDGKIEFTAYPSALTKGSYSVYIIGADKPFSAGPAATFSYYQPYTLGDVDGDGKINPLDALAILQHSAGLITLTETQIQAADVAAPYGTINPLDALAVLQYAAGLITSF